MLFFYNFYFIYVINYALLVHVVKNKDDRRTIIPDSDYSELSFHLQ